MVFGRGGVQAARGWAICLPRFGYQPESTFHPQQCSWKQNYRERLVLASHQNGLGTSSQSWGGRGPHWMLTPSSPTCFHRPSPATTAHPSQELGVGPDALPCPHPSQSPAPCFLQLSTVHFPQPPCSRPPWSPRTHSAPSLSLESTVLPSHSPAQPSPPGSMGPPKE